MFVLRSSHAMYCICSVSHLTGGHRHAQCRLACFFYRVYQRQCDIHHVRACGASFQRTPPRPIEVRVRVVVCKKRTGEAHTACITEFLRGPGSDMRCVGWHSTLDRPPGRHSPSSIRRAVSSVGPTRKQYRSLDTRYLDSSGKRRFLDTGNAHDRT